MKRTLLWSLLWTVLAIAGAVTAVLLANFGGSRFLFGLLLLVPLTVGLPTTAGLLLVTSLWNGPPLWLFLALAAVAGFALQVGAAVSLRRLRVRSRRSRGEPLVLPSAGAR